MRYMYLIMTPPEAAGPPPPRLIEEIERLAAMQTSMIASGGLMPSSQAVRVRLKGGKLTVTDGPFAESKEVLGGYAIFDFATREAAIQSAMDFMELHRLYGEGWEGVCEMRELASPGQDRACGNPSMLRTITISLPVTDLKASKAFYTALGFVDNAQFTGDSAAFMVWREFVNVVLLTHAEWRRFTTRPIPPKTSSEVGLAVSCESREEVDAMNRAAAEHGGISDINPVEDHGFMYGRDFADPDGHVWGAKWMDMSAMPSSTG